MRLSLLKPRLPGNILTPFFATVAMTTALALTGCAALDTLGIGRDDDALRQERGRTRVAHAIESRDITLGMHRTDVQKIWGSPHDRDAAQADSDSGGGRYLERWIYPEGTKGLGSERVVYFEEGRVVGWETLRAN